MAEYCRPMICCHYIIDWDRLFPMDGFDYERAYQETEAYFGLKPDRWLVANLERLDPDLPVLDVGCGQGRCALWLAGQGFDVHAIDPSATALNQLMARAAQVGLAVETAVAGYEDFRPQPGTYGTVLLFGLVQILTWEQIGDLGKALQCWTRPGARVLLTAFGTREPACEQDRAESEGIGPDSFRRPDGQVRTYLAPGAAERLFPGFEPLTVESGFGPWHRHGDAPQERHFMVEAIYERAE